MKNLLILLSLCIVIPAFASQITNADPWYYHICTTSDGGKSWQDNGTMNPTSTFNFDGTADAVAIGRFGDCTYNGDSWTNHAADYNVAYWIGDPPQVGYNIQNGAAMILWQNNQFTHVTTNVGLADVCMYGGEARPDNPTKCWL